MLILNSVGKSAGTVYFCDTHFHTNWELVCVTDGCGSLVHDTGSFSFEKSTVYAIPPSFAHKCISKSGFEDIYIRVDDLPLPTDKITVCNTADDDFSQLAELAFKLHCKAEDKYSASLSAVANALAVLFLDLVSENCKYALSLSVRSFIVVNFGNHSLNAERLEKEFNYSYEYIKRCFKADFGVTPIEYITSTRMNRAAELLKSGHMYTVEHISEVCGFSDKFYFSRAFKRFYGMSPSSFRAECENDEFNCNES